MKIEFFEDVSTDIAGVLSDFLKCETPGVSVGRKTPSTAAGTRLAENYAHLHMRKPVRFRNERDEDVLIVEKLGATLMEPGTVIPGETLEERNTRSRVATDLVRSRSNAFLNSTETDTAEHTDLENGLPINAKRLLRIIESGSKLNVYHRHARMICEKGDSIGRPLAFSIKAEEAVITGEMMQWMKEQKLFIRI